MELHELTIHQLHDRLARKEVSSREATEALYRHIKKFDEKIGAYLLLDRRGGLQSGGRGRPPSSER